MTISPSEICSRCRQNSLNCHCENFHPNVPATYEFTIEELRALYRCFERQYINYDDLEAHSVTRKIAKIVNARET